jgi:hypothetical protein
MKKWISIVLLSLPLALHAQTDEKYLTGAVPVEDGKVVFRSQLDVTQLTRKELYQTAMDWAKQRFVTQDKFNARVVYADSVDYQIAAYGDEYLVFTSNALSLDRSRVNYQFQMNITDGHCEAILSRIRYTYHEQQKTPDKYLADEWITDEVALNKARTKLIPVCGKFRRKTIDLKDDLFKSLQNAFGDRLIALGRESAPAREKLTFVAQTPVYRQPELKDTVRFTPEEAPVTRIPLETETPTVVKAEPHHLIVTAGEDEEFRLAASAWGGESQMFGKAVTFLFIDTQKTAANLLLTQNDTYTLSLYAEGADTPYTTLKGQKLSTQTIPGSEAVKMNTALDSTKNYQMYVVEIKK